MFFRVIEDKCEFQEIIFNNYYQLIIYYEYKIYFLEGLIKEVGLMYILFLKKLNVFK